MIQKLNSLADSVVVWQILFFVMTACFAWSYMSPRIVVRDKHLYFIMDRTPEGRPIITESRAI